MLDNLRYLYLLPGRRGEPRLYFWRGKGHPRIRIREERGSPAFHARYAALLAGEVPADVRPPRLVRAAPQTLGWLVERFLSSGEFMTLGPSTRNARRLILQGCLREKTAPTSPVVFRDALLEDIDDKAIRVLRDRKKSTPDAANGRVRGFRQVFAWAITANEGGVTTNPALAVPYLPRHSQGFHTWTVEEIAKYEDRHPAGSRAWLAITILRCTGVRRSDAVALGWQMIRDGFLHFTEAKGRDRNPKDRVIPILPELQAVLERTPRRNMTFLVTSFGKPFTANGFGNWFKRRCREAGLPHCSAHGLRKAGAVIAAENGASDRQLMAIFGWRTERQANTYTRKASVQKMAADAMHLVMPRGAEAGTNLYHKEGSSDPVVKKQAEN